MFWAEEYIEEKKFSTTYKAHAVHSCCVYKIQHGRTRYKFPIAARMCIYNCVCAFECVMSKCILRWKKKSNVQNFFLYNYYACNTVRCVVFRQTKTTC